MANRTLVAGCLLGWFLVGDLVAVHGEELSIPREYEGRLIQAVRFEPPLQPLTRAYLARLLPFQPGAAASGRYPRRHQAALHVFSIGQAF